MVVAGSTPRVVGHKQHLGEPGRDRYVCGGRRAAPHHDGKDPRQARPHSGVRAECQLRRRVDVSIVKQRQADVGPRSSMLSCLRRRHAEARPSTPLWRRLGRTAGPGERSEVGSRPDAASRIRRAPTSRPCQPCNDGWLHNTARGRMRQRGHMPRRPAGEGGQGPCWRWLRTATIFSSREVKLEGSATKKTPDLSPGVSRSRILSGCVPGLMVGRIVVA